MNNLLEMSPFVKWAGGKRQILNEIERRMPAKYNRYYEPFVGGGAVLFYLLPLNAVINDISEELINVYKVIKEEPVKLMNLLDEHETNHALELKVYYYSVRELDRKEYWGITNSIEKAARFIYLNKACFNGLYRVNSKGFFNVPWNQATEIVTYNRENILSISEYLNTNNIQILNSDFETAVEDAKKGDFIYFDPPYDLLKSDTFESYSKEGFGVAGQKRLAELFKKLDDKGCYMMLSNHNTSLINELYKDYKIDVIHVKRMINSKADNRKGEEVIIYNY